MRWGTIQLLYTVTPPSFSLEEGGIFTYVDEVPVGEEQVAKRTCLLTWIEIWEIFSHPVWRIGDQLQNLFSNEGFLTKKALIRPTSSFFCWGGPSSSFSLRFCDFVLVEVLSTSDLLNAQIVYFEEVTCSLCDIERLCCFHPLTKKLFLHSRFFLSPSSH